MQELITFVSHHLPLSLATIMVLILLLAVEFVRSRRGSSTVPPLQATQMINHDNAVVIDIRPKEAYRSGHIIRAISLTMQEMQQGPLKKLERVKKTQPIIIVCTAGAESQKAAALLLKQGYNAYSLAGGMRAWNEAQLPIVKE